jgi:L-ascorbate metabolism protein UlaG (beta-lactamase superfamily)
VSVRLTRLEQSGFLLAGDGLHIACDLYLSDHLEGKYRGTDKPHVRLHPPTRAPADLADLDWVFASHRHSDHLDPGSIRDLLEASATATLVLPAALVAYARDELGVPPERMHGAHPGEQVGPFTLVPAAHPHVADEFLSALVTLDGVTIFHSGDTLAFPEQRAVLTRARPDVVLLPANGRVAEHLGTPPNMSLEEALDLAAACGTPLVIPHHYDLFAFNSRPASSVAEVLAASGLPYRQLRPGEGITLTRAADGLHVADS